ncbi:MAG: GerAB/ArcD/ProY family transporter [Clostridiales bacterium]|nr:GerAB/ArcD/ProY family transporter [Clostridiales bacterium]
MNNSEQTSTLSADTSKEVKQTTSKQLIAVIFILALATKMFLQPLFLVKAAGRDAYIALAIDGGFDIIVLIVTLIAMKLSPDRDFFELTRCVFGKVGSRIIVCIFGLYLFFKLNVAVSETVSFYSKNILTDLDTTLLLLILLIFLVGVALHSLRALTRLNEILTPVIVTCLAVLIAIVVATGFDLSNIFPSLRNPHEFGVALSRHMTWLGDFSPLLLFLGRTEMKKSTVPLCVVSGTLGSAISVFFSVVMCAAFGNVTSLVDASTNLSSILQYSLGNVYGRIDLVAEILWSVASFIQNALFFYCVVRCFEYVIGKPLHLVTSLGVGALLFTSLSVAFSDPSILSLLIVNEITSALVASFSLAVPVLALISAVIARKKEGGEKSGQSGGNKNAIRSTE